MSRHLVYYDFFGGVCKNTIQKNSESDEVPVVILGNFSFSLKGQQIEPIGQEAVFKRENNQAVQNEGSADAEEEGVVRPHRLAERFSDTECKTGKKVLKVCNHKEHSFLV